MADQPPKGHPVMRALTRDKKDQSKHRNRHPSFFGPPNNSGSS
jgi:hypothetical protein